jgi:hypothetical protein
MEVQSRIPLAGQHVSGVGGTAQPPPPTSVLPALATSVAAALLAREQRLGQSPGNQRLEQDRQEAVLALAPKPAELHARQAGEEEGKHDQESADCNKDSEGTGEEEEEGDGAAVEGKRDSESGAAVETEGAAHEAHERDSVTGDAAQPTAE